MKYTFETVLYKIKFRISCLLEDGEKISDYYMETYEKIQNELNREKRFIFIKKKIIKEDEILERIEKKLIDSIKKVNEIQQIHILIEQMNILHFLKIFTIPRLYKKYERDIFKELEAYGLIVDEFEKLILNTTLIQWRD